MAIRSSPVFTCTPDGVTHFYPAAETGEKITEIAKELLRMPGGSYAWIATSQTWHEVHPTKGRPFTIQETDVPAHMLAALELFKQT